MAKEQFDHGIAARRYLLHMGYRMLADAQMVRDSTAHARLTLQATGLLWPYIGPSVERHQTPAEGLKALRDGPPEVSRFAGITDKRWARLCWWTDALYRSGVYSADPLGGHLDASEILRDDPNKATTFFGQRAYRRLTITVHKALAEAAKERDGAWANTLFDRVYRLVVAAAFPVLERLEDCRAAVDEIWADGVPADESEARGLRMDTVSEVCIALHESAVLAQPQVPVDTTSRDDLLSAIQGAGRS